MWSQVDGARSVLNALLPDVFVFTDHAAGAQAAASPGYGLALVAETTTGCLLAAECTASGNAEDQQVLCALYVSLPPRSALRHSGSFREPILPRSTDGS
jgi:hypothetical protein